MFSEGGGRKAGVDLFFQLLFLSSKMTKFQICYVQWGRGRREVLPYFPIIIPKLKNDTILNSLCVVGGGGGGQVGVDLLSNFCSWV